MSRPKIEVSPRRIRVPRPASKHVALILQTRMEENTAILKGIAAYERVHGNWHFFLDDQAKSVTNPAWLFHQHWDGVICRHRITLVLEECRRRGVPCVDLDDSSRQIKGAPKIRPDNRGVGHVGAEHFLDRGFRNLAFCGFSSEDWSHERLAGFAEAIETVGLQCSVLETTYTHELTPDWDHSEQLRIMEWIHQLPRPVGIMACNDMRALQVIAAAHELGLRIPDEVAILGANNESVRAELSNPPLSSVPLHAHEWGMQAARMLHGMMEGKQPELMDSFVEPMSVVVRRSTDALAIDDPTIVKALRIIAEEACRGLRVDDLAHRVNVSRSLLERRFRKCLRRSPQEEIRHVKINRTRKYLAETDKTLSEIAELTGFEHPEYLSVMFKRLTGESPREFRRRQQSRLFES